MACVEDLDFYIMQQSHGLFAIAKLLVATYASSSTYILVPCDTYSEFIAE